jgi:hypothetical protein
MADERTAQEIAQTALNNRKKFQVTWKSALGVVAAFFGALTAAEPSLGLPTSVSAALTAGGAAIVALERIADSIDYRSLLTGGTPTIDQTSLNSAVVSLAQAAQKLADTDK